MLKSLLIATAAAAPALTFDRPSITKKDINFMPFKQEVARPFGKDVVEDYESKDGNYKYHAEIHYTTGELSLNLLLTTRSRWQQGWYVTGIFELSIQPSWSKRCRRGTYWNCGLPLTLFRCSKKIWQVPLITCSLTWWKCQPFSDRTWLIASLLPSQKSLKR